MTSTATHALRDRWYVSVLPLLTTDVVNTEFKGDWKLAAKQKMQRLDWVTTVEEVWSTMNSLPKIQQLGVGSTFIFAREDMEPSFETFPSGSRLVVKLLKAPVTDKGLETIIAAVLGETVTEDATDSLPVCDVIRIAARPSREHSDLIRVEVWLNDASYSAKVTEFLKAALRERGLSSTLYAIEENPFEAGSPAACPKSARAPASGSSPDLAVDPEEDSKGGEEAEETESEAGTPEEGSPAEGNGRMGETGEDAPEGGSAAERSENGAKENDVEAPDA